MWCAKCHYGSEIWKPPVKTISLRKRVKEFFMGRMVWIEKIFEKARPYCPQCGKGEKFTDSSPYGSKPE